MSTPMILLFLTIILGLLDRPPSAAGPPSGSVPRRVWEITLSQHLKEPPTLRGDARHYIEGVSFSNDEQRIAISVGLHSVGRETVSHLVVVNTVNPREGIKQVDYSGSPATRLVWSGDGRTIAMERAGVSMVRLADGSVCRPPPGDPWQSEGMGGFLQDRLVVGGGYEMESHKYVDRSGHATTVSRYITSKLVLYGADCQAERSLAVQGRIIAADTSEAAGGLIAMILEGGRGTVIDTEGRVVDSWEGNPPRTSRVRFVDNGAAVCLGASHLDPPVCRKVGGQNLSARPKLKCGWPFDSAKWGTLMVALDRKYSYNWFTERERSIPRKAIAYDYRTGRSVLSLPAGLQNQHFVDVQWAVPFVYTLSPSGRYLVEAGGDVVRLYEIR